MKELTDKQLIVRIAGTVQRSNLAEFKETALAVIAGINTNLQTDDDFARAEQDIKDCSLIETRLTQAKNDALNGTKEISDLIETIDWLTAKFRNTRLDLNKKVSTEKDNRKNEIINEAKRMLDIAVSQSPVKHGFSADLAAIKEAVKGKKSIAKMREAVSDTVNKEQERLIAMEIAYGLNITMISASESEFPGLYPDKKILALSAPEIVQATIESRVVKFRFETAEKERKEKEEAERKEKEAQEERERENRRQELITHIHVPPLPPDPFTEWTPPPPPIQKQSSTKYTLAVSADTADIQAVLEQIKAIAGVKTALVVEGGFW